MKKVFLVLLLMLFLVSPMVFADRNTPTTIAYNSSQLIKRGDGKIYSISFVATSNSGYFVVTDAITGINQYAATKAEGSEATSANSNFQDYTSKPLEFSTGIYLTISNGCAVIRWE